ncbi:hypothetical protein AB1E18_016033 [Capra hircus]
MLGVNSLVEGVPQASWTTMERELGPASKQSTEALPSLPGERELGPASKQSTEVLPSLPGERELSPASEQSTEVLPTLPGEHELSPASKQSTEALPCLPGERELGPASEQSTEVLPSLPGERELSPASKQSTEALPSLPGERELGLASEQSTEVLPSLPREHELSPASYQFSVPISLQLQSAKGWQARRGTNQNLGPWTPEIVDWGPGRIGGPGGTARSVAGWNTGVQGGMKEGVSAARMGGFGESRGPQRAAKARDRSPGAASRVGLRKPEDARSGGRRAGSSSPAPGHLPGARRRPLWAQDRRVPGAWRAHSGPLPASPRGHHLSGSHICPLRSPGTHPSGGNMGASPGSGAHYNGSCQSLVF